MAETLSSPLCFFRSSLSSPSNPKTLALFATLPPKHTRPLRSTFAEHFAVRLEGGGGGGSGSVDEEVSFSPGSRRKSSDPVRSCPLKHTRPLRSTVSELSLVHTAEDSLSPDLKIFVGNLPFSVDSAELAGLFGRAGTVEMVEVIYDKKSGRSRRFGFVTMSSVDEVEAAAQQFNNYELGGRPLRVRSVPPPSRDDSLQTRTGPAGSENQVAQQEGAGSVDAEVSFSPDLKIFVGNLPFSVDSAELAVLFGRAGTVEMVEVIYDKKSGHSRGFGFVTMSSVEEVEAAVQQFNNYELGGRPLTVNSGPAPSRDDSLQTRAGAGVSENRVYVHNLSSRVDDLSLETLFSQVGKVVKARVVYDLDNGMSRGFGFVTYKSAEEVDAAVSFLNGTDLYGKDIRLKVAEWKPPPRRF